MPSVARQTINKEFLLLQNLGILRIDYSDLLIRDRAALEARFDRIE